VTVTTTSEEETMAAGERLASSLKSGDIVLLTGDLGAGKTAFVRGLAAGLGIDPADVSSPTFTLIQEYRGRTVLRHVDLYRLSPPEVEDIGLYDLLLEDGVTAVEWPDRLPRALPDAIHIAIAHRDHDARAITFPDHPSPAPIRAGNGS
jgi:tRNA threonylcarbamoyladenosine biosynthesis protein TsaE